MWQSPHQSHLWLNTYHIERRHDDDDDTGYGRHGGQRRWITTTVDDDKRRGDGWTKVGKTTMMTMTLGLETPRAPGICKSSFYFSILLTNVCLFTGYLMTMTTTTQDNDDTGQRWHRTTTTQDNDDTGQRWQRGQWQHGGRQHGRREGRRGGRRGRSAGMFFFIFCYILHYYPYSYYLHNNKRDDDADDDDHGGGDSSTSSRARDESVSSPSACMFLPVSFFLNSLSYSTKSVYQRLRMSMNDNQRQPHVRRQPTWTTTANVDNDGQCGRQRGGQTMTPTITPQGLETVEPLAYLSYFFISFIFTLLTKTCRLSTLRRNAKHGWWTTWMTTTTKTMHRARRGRRRTWKTMEVDDDGRGGRMSTKMRWTQICGTKLNM